MAYARRAGGAGGTSMAAKRIKKEIADLAKENLGAITLTPNESNIFSWRATIPGPAGSPYEGGVFEVDIRIPEDYPFSPPHLQFLTKLYHCNVASTGAICLDLLKTAWSPALSLYKVILSLSSLLTDPNPADPLVPAIAQEYKRDRKKHDANAREWVKLYAKPKLPPPAAVSAPMPARTNSNTSSSSRRAIPRPNASSSSSTPQPQLAGTRRPNPYSSSNGTNGANGNAETRVIELDDSEDEPEVLAESSTNSTNQRQKPTASTERPAKRTRANGNGTSGGAGGTSADDVIVIDE